MNESSAGEEERKTPRWAKRLGMVVASISVILFLSVVAFVVRTQLAHRESVCPFRPITARIVVTGTEIREEARRCLPDVEEHRWWLVRGTALPRLFGVRRLPRRFYAPERYRWSTSETPNGVELVIHNDGVDPAYFHEKPTAHR